MRCSHDATAWWGPRKRGCEGGKAENEPKQIISTCNMQSLEGGKGVCLLTSAVRGYLLRDRLPRRSDAPAPAKEAVSRATAPASNALWGRRRRRTSRQ